MISIIIPVLNESQTIGKLLVHLSENSTPSNISEIIIVDGGSMDGTQALVDSFSEKYPLKIVLVSSEKGRARQMNLGAQRASGKILYFLHADSFPPKDFDSRIHSEVKKGQIAGCFRMKFDSNHPVLRISQWFTQFNFKLCRGGDQSLFITQEAFRNLKGYNELYTIYEDCELVNRIYDHYNFVVINDFLTTSSRKYKQNGTLKLQFHFTVIHLKKRLGATPENLSAYYQKNILP
jgi:rSAM/selenodomain-associated transferase 2